MPVEANAAITLTAFEISPDEGRGLARDFRVRWALEEAGQSYAVRLVSFAEMKEPTHRSLQPFGQIPTYEEGDIVLFESGAIVLSIARRHGGLLPRDAAARERAVAWMFAALNTVEPPIAEMEQAGYLEADRDWHVARVPIMEKRIRARLDDLSAALGEKEWHEKEWLCGTFTAADILMVTVLRRLEDTDILAAYPSLVAYVARAEARPAYKQAFADQRNVFFASQERISHAG